MKADRSNKKLNTLQQASRHVNDMAAVVVTSTKHGQQQISDQGEEILRNGAIFEGLWSTRLSHDALMCSQV